MERIEVIRGPAGTLFGRNSVGGAINMITAKGDTSGFYGNASIDIADYNGLKTTSTFNIPLDDTVALRLATSSLKRMVIWKIFILFKKIRILMEEIN